MKALAFTAHTMSVLTGCQPQVREEVTPQALTQQADKLVVTGFISPQDTLISVSVTRSQGIAETGTVGTAVANGSVTLTDGGSAVTLLFNTKRQRYEADARKWPVLSGHRYTLRVQTPDGQLVTGSATVPQPVALPSVRLDSTVATDGSKRFFARYTWQDTPGSVDPFQTTGTFVFVKKCTTCREEANAARKPESVPVSFGSSTALSGWVANGAALETQGNLTSTDPKTTFGGSYQRASVQAILLRVEDAYARYHQAVEKATATSANPFSEPVLIPTNLQGGLGCFAAYTRASLTAKLK